MNVRSLLQNLAEEHRRITQCPQCGKRWFPSMDESYTFPGSGCDIGECICGPCEAGYTCELHSPIDFKWEADEAARRVQGGQ